MVLKEDGSEGLELEDSGLRLPVPLQEKPSSQFMCSGIWGKIC